MKKWIVIVLLLTLVLSLCGCGKESEDAGTTGGGNGIDGVLSIGYSRVDITPKEPIPLAGYGDSEQRMSGGFLDYLTATCIAYTGADGTTVLQFQLDHISSFASLFNKIKKAIERETGIAEENIMIAATHTHSGPDASLTHIEAVARYQTQLTDSMVACAKEALADRKPATGMKMGSVTIPVNTLNFIRHYNLSNKTVAGDNFGNFSGNTILGHTHDADSQLQVVKLERQDGDPVVLINWQAHPHRSNGQNKEVYYSMTSDIVGAMRDKFEKETGCKFAYYTGGSGNINSHSNITKENITKDFKEQGKALADYAIQCYNESLTEAALGNVEIQKKIYTGTVNHTEDHLLEKALLVKQEYQNSKNIGTASSLAKQYGMNSYFHANGIINKEDLPATYDVEMWVYSIGDLAFITAPYEMFDESGAYIKKNSPYKQTFVVTCCNGAIGYIPSIEGYNNNCYGANTGKFIPGTGELLAEEYVNMLNDLKK